MRLGRAALVARVRWVDAGGMIEHGDAGSFELGGAKRETDGLGVRDSPRERAGENWRSSGEV